MTQGNRLPLAGLLNLSVTYVVWGSTYLAIRVAVREGAGWGPFWLGASRVMVAAVVLLLINALLGSRVRPTRRELTVIAVSGLLMWVGGNGSIMWAEQRVDSGLVALIVGSMPMWVALMEGFLDKQAPSLLTVGSLVAGFSGLVVLTLPMLRQGISGDFLGAAVVVFGTICWGVGSILLHRRPVGLKPTVLAGLQQLVGGFGFVAMIIIFREPIPTPTPEAWLAWGYLVLFGSLLAYTSFIYSLRLLPATIAMTYTYVNPVIAVILGWAILSEPITNYTVLGTALILVGVYGVFRGKVKRVSRGE
ncbi:MAG: DMT family transporter [Thermoanaerobaculales bacterium]